jgi:flagellar basal-body rod protein FlgC
MNAMEISLTGMDVEWRRLEAIAENIANASTVLDANGDPHRAKRLISGPADDFDSLLSSGRRANDLRGVAVYSVEPQNIPARRAM